MGMNRPCEADQAESAAQVHSRTDVEDKSLTWAQARDAEARSYPSEAQAQ